MQLKPGHQCFKDNAPTRELNTSGHQKYELRRRLQSGTGPLQSGAVIVTSLVWIHLRLLTPLGLTKRRQDDGLDDGSGCLGHRLARQHCTDDQSLPLSQV